MPSILKNTYHLTKSNKIEIMFSKNLNSFKFNVITIIFFLHNSIPNINNYRKVCKKSEQSDELNSQVKRKLMDLGGNCLTCGTKIMLDVLKKGLTDRVHAYGVKYPKYARVCH